MRRGFTLLEVMVSLAILGLSLTAISGIHANSFQASNYAKGVTVATLLARSKMIEIEDQLYKDGFGDDDKEFDGDFDKEGFPSFKWVATSRKVEVDVAQLVSSLLGGDVDPEAMPGQIADFVGALNGKGAEEVTEKVAGSDISKILGGGQLELIFKSTADTLSKSIREITLEITWGKKGVDLESVKFVQYVVTDQRLNAPAAPGQLPLGPQGQKLPGHSPNPATTDSDKDGVMDSIDQCPNKQGSPPTGC